MKVSRRFVVAGMGLAPAALRASRSEEAPTAPAFSAAADLDAAIEEAIRDDQIPGAVLLVGHRGEIVHRKAYGWRSLVPAREPMTLDTVFDAASLTKAVVTASAIMHLFEHGKLRLNDAVTKYLPGFQGGHSEITIRNLLTHFSGLRPDLDIDPPWSGYETGIRKALAEAPVAPPGARFIYSDINFILLGEIVHKIGGLTLAEYGAPVRFRAAGDAREHVPAAARPRPADCPYREPRRTPSAGRRSRRIGALYGRHRRQRRTVYHRGRSGPLRRNDVGAGIL